MGKRTLLFVAICLLMAAPAPAHEIPNDVTVQTFFKPEGQTLRLLLRVPLAAMRDMDYPKLGARNSEMLDLSRADKTLRDAATLWVADFLDIYENGVKLPYPRIAAARASLQSDRSFTSYDAALAHVTGPRLADGTEFPWSQGLLDVLFEFPIQSDRSRFSINPRFARLGLHTLTVVRYLPPGGAVRAFELPGDPGLVHLDPSWTQAAFQFVKLGFEHILDGTDHLLFLFCLVLPFGFRGAGRGVSVRWEQARPLVAVVTSFTVAHSITLFASAFNLAPDALWFPPLIETLIAASIVYMALENIVGANVRRRWLITFGFGLVHGFGFSFALRQTLQFAGSHLLTSLFSFNVGVELGQLLVLAITLPALAVLFTYVVEERMGTIILSALVAHTAWHWLADRYATLRQYRFEWPAIDALFLVSAMRVAMVIIAAIGVWWLAGVVRTTVSTAATADRPRG
ncbi:MAG TPA: HupE/UreJ family protein [Vicinamibacterales bacterium]|nr:HupE/UreJ family protein [Vicinamibacterales bacterium]